MVNSVLIEGIIIDAPVYNDCEKGMEIAFSIRSHETIVDVHTSKKIKISIPNLNMGDIVRIIGKLKNRDINTGVVVYANYIEIKK